VLHPLERARRGEREGFARQKRLRRTRSARSSDVIFVRNNPEKTTDAALALLQRRIQQVDDGTRLVINPQEAFLTVDSKDRTFSAWSKAGISCPRHWVVKSDSEDSATLDWLLALLEAHGRLLLRTNNETGSHGLHILDREMSPEQVRRALSEVQKRAATHRRRRCDTRVIAVEYVDARDSDGYATLGRAFVLLDRVIGYFASVSRALEFRVQSMVPEAFERFLEANRRLSETFEASVRTEAIRSVSALGNNLGAVDFLVREGKPVFLEVNPIWGGVPGPYAFGNKGFERLMKEHESYWSKALPNIVENLDVVAFYSNMYEYIGEYADKARSGRIASTGR
jgi:hypothetical protein